MGTIPLITRNQHIVDIISHIICDDLDKQIQLTWLKNPDTALEFIAIDMPELIMIDFSDQAFNGVELLDRITEDNWILNAGIIAFCSSFKDVENLENIRKANMIIALTNNELEFQLPKIMTLIVKNRRLLFQRSISTNLIKDFQATFILNNDPYEARCYANLICNFVYNSYGVSSDIKFHLKIALTELLLNAVEHGNCEISYDDKTKWMETNLDIYELVLERLKRKDIAPRKVTLTFTITTQNGFFTITDEGNGFDWRNMKDPASEENLLKLHGRGIMMTRAVVNDLKFNEKGNEVSFLINFNKQYDFKMPYIFEDMICKETQPGETIFVQGESGDFLYYIVEGSYSVQANGHQVSLLTPDDIFIGEMSFLLNNRRSASVIAESKGKLIQISKKQFVETIKIQPHYALFLCRLLAQRILRSNQRDSNSRYRELV